jgi:hypothetical protein
MRSVSLRFRQMGFFDASCFAGVSASRRYRLFPASTAPNLISESDSPLARCRWSAGLFHSLSLVEGGNAFIWNTRLFEIVVRRHDLSCAFLFLSRTDLQSCG